MNFSVLQAVVADYALFLASVLALVSAFGALPVRRVMIFVAALISLGWIILLLAHARTDLAFVNVVSNSHHLKPLLYKISGTWGNHEGSFLLWLWYMAILGAALAFSADKKTKNIAADNIDIKIIDYPLRVQAALIAGFAAFLWFSSSPFAVMSVIPAEGKGLNPLLQDWGLALHPPGLYLGYVGFSLPFSCVVGWLWCGAAPRDWPKRLLIWVQISWVSLTIGIILGSIWAYRELGWGGFWFWDPVENISLMPWLAATLLLHNLRLVAEQRSAVMLSVFLAIFTFILCVMGTFLVRAGLLTSVHSFAEDPARGWVILAMLACMSVAGFGLYAWRAAQCFQPEFSKKYSWRNISFSVQAILLLTMLATVALGTWYPLLLRAFSQQEVTVGAPYFNQVMQILAIPLLLNMAFASAIKGQRVWERERAFWLSALVLGCGLLFVIDKKFIDISAVSAFLLLFAWLVFLVMIKITVEKIQQNALNVRILAMIFAHIGAAFLLSGAVFHNYTQQEKESILRVGETMNVGDWQIKMENIEQIIGKNYVAMRADLVAKKAESSIKMQPEYRYYPVEGSFTTEASLKVWRNVILYSALGQGDLKNGYTIRVYTQPAIFMVLIGAVLLVFSAVAVLYLVFRREK
jgi:cytochrome c-type biogenesis protein CcmF